MINELITGHEAEMNALEEQEEAPPTKKGIAYFPLKDIKDLLEDELEPTIAEWLFHKKLMDVEKIEKIKKILKYYGF